ncbi:hypothetical protein T492DRAFT_121654 [Pavlovales sp. CCMP2436]|nr:hypothetical protein T492DRAFT_121654 [Pavlovales sp. CCMP2436]
MKTIALALLLALFALTPSAHAQSNWYVGEQGANCVTTCAGKGACNVDEMNAIKTVTSVEDAVSNSDWHQCNFKEPTNFQAATCAATSYWALRLCYCGEPEAAVARPDAKLVLKNDFAGVMFGL